MISFIVQAAENFCIHQIRAAYTIQQLPSKMRTLIAYLDIKDTIGKEHRVYVGCDDVLIQTIADIFLGEALSNRETLIDMLLEATNMIIGSAKVLAEEQLASSFTILTPHLQEDTPLTADKHYTFRVADGEMMIAIKAL
ncbi:MAG: chemotaxis protein CheX [Campylobacterales bacterium]|nr:chemotaxis protein CheX [Campylobacterales bacterium]